MSKKLIYVAASVFCLILILASTANAHRVGWWKLDEGSGITINDSSGNEHHGTVQGTPKWGFGPEGFDGALDFSGTTGAYCGVFDPTGGTGTFTATFWCLWDGTQSIQHFLTKSKRWGADTAMFQIEVKGGHSDPARVDRLHIAYQAAPQAVLNLVPHNEWVHLALVFDGTYATGYLNGVDDVGPQPTGIGPNVDAPIIIGASHETEGRTFQGFLDDVRIFDEALPAHQIQAIMQGGDVTYPSAYGPNPANGAVHVDMLANLSWRAGDLAVSHDIYIGKNFDDVNEASRTNPLGVLVDQNQENTFYNPAGLLEFAQSYYWRVDEFNDAEPNSPWKGDTWSFTVTDHFVVDNFEDYNDYPPNEIFNTWSDGWQDDTNGATVGHDADFTKGENIVETTIVKRGKQSMPFYYDNSGTANYSEAELAFIPAQDWNREGVGILSLWFRGHLPYFGGFTEGPVGTYTMTAAGEDIWANADEFHFAWKEVSGAVSIIAKIESLENIHPFAKAGVMIRDTLDADSRYVAVLITPENGVRFQYRNTIGGITERYFEEGLTAPQWVKLERTVGGLVRGYHSEDGVTWTRFNLIQVRMEMPVYVGLALTSNEKAIACEAKFSNVSFPDINVEPQWTNQDIGMLSNYAEPMYVSVRDGSGASATVYHDDPDAALIDTWTQWNIDLKEFSDAGVVLTDVSNLSIGFGDKDNPQPGGSGLVFFDDIHLYRPTEPDSVP
ncbi:MAG: LamG domain-containing protein [Planctomycetota bacterium]|jgi:hypothetical protein